MIDIPILYIYTHHIYVICRWCSQSRFNPVVNRSRWIENKELKSLSPRKTAIVCVFPTPCHTMPWSATLLCLGGPLCGRPRAIWRPRVNCWRRNGEKIQVRNAQMRKMSRSFWMWGRDVDADNRIWFSWHLMIPYLVIANSLTDRRPHRQFHGPMPQKELVHVPGHFRHRWLCFVVNGFFVEHLERSGLKGVYCVLFFESTSMEPMILSHFSMLILCANQLDGQMGPRVGKGSMKWVWLELASTKTRVWHQHIYI